MFMKKATPPTDSMQPDSQPAKAAPFRVGLINKLESELATQREALAELQSRIAALRESITKADPAQTLAAERRRAAASARSELPQFYEELRERAKVIGTTQAWLDEAQHRAKQARALRDKLAMELAPCEEAADRLEKCAAELADLRGRFPTMRQVTQDLTNVVPVVLGIVEHIKVKRAALERAKTDLAELVGE